MSSGPAHARITLVEYGRYTCPYCRGTTESIAAIRDRFGERMRYVFRHFFSPHAPIQPQSEREPVGVSLGAWIGVLGKQAGIEGKRYSDIPSYLRKVRMVRVQNIIPFMLDDDRWNF